MLIYDYHLLSGHLPVPRGWTLKGGSTVIKIVVILTIIFITIMIIIILVMIRTMMMTTMMIMMTI